MSTHWLSVVELCVVVEVPAEVVDAVVGALDVVGTGGQGQLENSGLVGPLVQPPQLFVFCFN